MATPSGSSIAGVAYPAGFPALLVLVSTLLLSLLVAGTQAQLSTNFYSTSCPTLAYTVRAVVQAAIAREKRMGASLLRLFFHDCFVNGCDGSLLLDDTPSFTGEKTAAPNLNSARGFDVIDNVKAQVERECPGVVSCADILALVARDSVFILGGPSWGVKPGRRDARTTSFASANGDIPPPTSSLATLLSSFQAKGLSARDLVALFGAHTIGQARCTSFRTRVNNDTNIDPTFAASLWGTCLSTTGTGDNNLAPLDAQTPTVFDNAYFRNILSRRGLLHSDQELFNGGSTDAQVTAYSNNPASFSADFVAAMIRMGDISPLSGSASEIRRNCRLVN